MRVGFVGLGDQGAPMAQMILAGGFALRIWARRKDVRDAWATRGAGVAASAADLAASSDMMCICVTGDDDVRDLLIGQGMLDAMRSRCVIAIHSTILPHTCVELARMAAARGVALVDLPVSGSGHAALSRTLLVMCGGDAQVLARLMPVLECYGGTILRLGEVGTAMSAKLINNLMAVVNIGQAYHGLMLGKIIGIDPGPLREALMVGTGRTFAIDLIKRLHMPERAGHVRDILEKDVALAITAMPAAQAAYWSPLAQCGLDALARLVRGEVILLPRKEEHHGEYIVHGTA